MERRASAHIAALVLGIISVAFSAFWYLAVPTGILAIIYGAKSNGEWGSNMGKTGLILGIVGLSLFLLLYLSMICVLILRR